MVADDEGTIHTACTGNPNRDFGNTDGMGPGSKTPHGENSGLGQQEMQGREILQ